MVLAALLSSVILATASAEQYWSKYDAGGMEVLAVVNGASVSDYEQVLVLLHGGGGSGTEWVQPYEQGLFGDTTGFKYVFPTSPLEGNVWFNTYKNGCGNADDCAYDIPSIEFSASCVAELLAYEQNLLSNPSNINLGGFSQGAQMTGYVQLANLDFALAGTIVLSGFPIPPLCDMPGSTPEAAKQNATYYGLDMKWMIWNGEADRIFPGEETMAYWSDIFKVLEITPTIDIFTLEPKQGHYLTEAEYSTVGSFVRGESLLGSDYKA